MLLLLVFALALADHVAAAERTARPTILIILSYALGYSDLG
jgi:hypothetical protein